MPKKRVLGKPKSLLTPYTYWYCCPKCKTSSKHYDSEKAMLLWRRMHWKKCKGARELHHSLFKKGNYADFYYDGNVGKGAKMELVSTDHYGFSTPALKEISKAKHMNKKEKSIHVKAAKLPNIGVKITEEEFDKIDLNALMKKKDNKK